MNTNKYGQTYVGNDDFRGWLNAGNRAVWLPGESISRPATVGAGVNNHIGNDGGIDINDPALASAVRQNYNYWLQKRTTGKAANTEDDDSTNNSGGGSSYSYSSGSSSSSAEDEALNARMRGIYDREIEDIRNNLGTMDRQLDNSLAGVNGEYDQYKNELQSTYNSNKNNYDKSTLQNLQDLQSNRNSITDRASSGLRGLLRVLGAMGAGGGSVARYEAPSMVTSQANKSYNDAGKTYATNQSNLDTNWGNYKNQYDNDKKRLEDWYNGQVKSKKQDNYEKRQSLLSDLVTAYSNRAQYGGEYGNNVNDAYNSIADYRNKINDLGQYTKPNYTGVTAVYNAPDLASYNANNTDLSTSVEDSNTSVSSQLLTALRNLNKKKDNDPYYNTGV